MGRRERPVFFPAGRPHPRALQKAGLPENCPVVFIEEFYAGYVRTYYHVVWPWGTCPHRHHNYGQAQACYDQTDWRAAKKGEEAKTEGIEQMTVAEAREKALAAKAVFQAAEGSGAIGRTWRAYQAACAEVQSAIYRGA